ncbi:serine/threonine-protein kinase [Moorena producens JHB]|uniref:Serine/threonine-protein kinase n=1 Tax=Moorena producens (strain JHB) TaxID=1454205 RepID=A0A1D9FXS6_MOOP1|nr:serine/threonine-protein kinase [Moorena producens]AOY80169.1 serine/threonine-protein kinase [Moorena producens JHB]
MLESGKVLQNRYYLQQQLNDNPVRQTWLALDSESDTQVVVKLLALGGPVQWDDLKLFEREAQILKQLDHPRIPKYRDYFSLDESILWFGLVQEYIPGLSLKQQQSQGFRFSQQQVNTIAADILKILQYLHQLNPPVLHRDIKPSNLIWGEDEQVYLIDFGAVQAQPTTAGATFTVVGTYGYTPMEQFGGQAVPASDLYALGVTLIELLTGVAPAELPQENLRIQFRQLLGSTVEPGLVTWLEKITEPAVERRFSDAKQATEALYTNPVVSSNNTSPTGLPDTVVRIHKSAEQLIIDIPSHWEMIVMKPLKHALKQARGVLKGVFSYSLQRFKTLEKSRQHRILVGVGLGVVVAILLDLFKHLILQILVILLAIPISLLPLAIPIFLVMWITSLNSEKDFSEAVRICFDNKKFEIIKASLSRKKWDRGENSQIKEVYITAYRDAQGRYHRGIAITTQVERPSPFGQKSQTYIFGEQLPEAELNWLVEEIRAWLDVKSSDSSPNPEG